MERKDYTKGDIFDFFYEKRKSVREGGGTVKMKMGRKNISHEESQKFFNDLKRNGNPMLVKYFLRLRDRKPGIAPPPRPKN